MKFQSDLQRALWLAKHGVIAWEDVYLFHASDRIARDREKRVDYAWHRVLAKRRVKRSGDERYVSKRKRVGGQFNDMGPRKAAHKHHAPAQALNLAIIEWVRQHGPTKLGYLKAILSPVERGKLVVDRRRISRIVGVTLDGDTVVLTPEHEATRKRLMSNEYVREYVQNAEEWQEVRHIVFPDSWLRSDLP